MAGFNRPCEICKRSTRIGGEPIEVCYSDRHHKFTCMQCHFEAPLELPPKPAIVAGVDDIYWRTLVRHS